MVRRNESLNIRLNLLYQDGAWTLARLPTTHRRDFSSCWHVVACCKSCTEYRLFRRGRGVHLVSPPSLCRLDNPWSYVSPWSDISLPTFDELVEDEVEGVPSLPVTKVPEHVSGDEVSDRLVEYRPRKLPGADSVSKAAIRQLLEQGVFPDRMFNACLRLT